MSQLNAKAWLGFIWLNAVMGLLALTAMMPFLIWRLLAEERFLSENLPGYTEYRTQARWRLIPGVF
jgi:protein-S-isoprenylcysteine O-methyltransferase Ste14